MTYYYLYSDIYISFNPRSDVILGIRRATIYIFPLLAAAMILFRTHFDGGTLDTSDLGQHNRHSQKGRLFKPWVSALCGKPTGPVLKFSRFNKLSIIIIYHSYICQLHVCLASQSLSHHLKKLSQKNSKEKIHPIFKNSHNVPTSILLPVYFQARNLPGKIHWFCPVTCPGRRMLRRQGHAQGLDTQRRPCPEA